MSSTRLTRRRYVSILPATGYFAHWVPTLTLQPQADDELDKPYLAGFEWDKEESWTQLIVHLQAQPTASGFGGGGKKKKGKKGDEE